MLVSASRIAWCLSWSLAACSFVFGENQALDAGGVSDAAPPDANACATRIPVIEELEVDVLPCGETEIAFPTVEVTEASGQCPVERLRWTISKRSSDGTSEVELMTQAGPPDSPVTAEARVLGGTFKEPVFNVAHYHGPSLLRVVLSNKGAGVDQVLQRIDGIAAELYSFRSSVMSGTMGSIRVGLIEDTSGNGLPSYGLSGHCLGTEGDFCEAPATLTAFTESVDVTGSTSTPRLRFSMGKAGEHYFDNVSLIRQSNRNEVVSDTSFTLPLPPDQSAVWSVNCPNSSCAASIEKIPELIASYGTYRVSLVAVDSNDVESEPKVWDFEHEACP